MSSWVWVGCISFAAVVKMVVPRTCVCVSNTLDTSSSKSPSFLSPARMPAISIPVVFCYFFLFEDVVLLSYDCSDDCLLLRHISCLRQQMIATMATIRMAAKHPNITISVTCRDRICWDFSSILEVSVVKVVVVGIVSSSEICSFCLTGLLTSLRKIWSASDFICSPVSDISESSSFWPLRHRDHADLSCYRLKSSHDVQTLCWKKNDLYSFGQTLHRLLDSSKNALDGHVYKCLNTSLFEFESYFDQIMLPFLKEIVVQPGRLNSKTASPYATSFGAISKSTSLYKFICVTLSSTSFFDEIPMIKSLDYFPYTCPSSLVIQRYLPSITWSDSDYRSVFLRPES